MPSFAMLQIAPEAPHWNEREPSVYINGVETGKTSFRLQPGEYSVFVEHPCYENASFTLGAEKGGVYTFDTALVPKLAGLVLRPKRKGSIGESVYADGQKVGALPFSGNVPVCAKIEAGSLRLRTRLEAGKVTEL
jgi:hypothetical protein